MYGKVYICGVNTAKLIVNSNAKNIELIEQLRSGDKSVRGEIISGNLKLVLSVVQKFSNKGENIDDLFQIGCIGLIKSIDNFDTSFGVRFSTYAVPMIIGEIRRYLRDNSMVRVSRSLRDLAYKALTAKEKLANELGREPTMDEIARELDVPRADVTFALDAISDPVSIYDPVYSNDGDTICLLEQISDTKNTDENWISSLSIREAIKKLDERERNILNKRFFIGRTQTEVAEEIGISQAQVSRLEKNALEKLKKQI
ncbi:MAG: RNA polymerase sporulation sigma factor SigG [Clostridia bacterium]